MKFWQKQAIAILVVAAPRCMAAQESRAKAKDFKCEAAGTFRVGGAQGNGRWPGAEANRAALDWIQNSRGGQRTHHVLL